MSTKLLLLKSGEQIISDVKELIFEEKVHGYLLVKPQKLIIQQPFLFEETVTEETKSEVKISMSPWMTLAEESEIVIKPDWIVTIVEPIKTVKSMYEDKINAKHDDQNSTTDEQPDSGESD